MIRFLGKFTHSLDQKGRVSIPARFRRALPQESHDTFVGIVRDDGPEKCLTLYCFSDFEDKFKEVAAQSSLLEHVRRMKRLYYSDGLYYPVDPQGRIAIPPVVRERVGLTRDVLFLGVEDTIEIWAPDVFEAYAQQGAGLTELEYRVFGSKEGGTGS